MGRLYPGCAALGNQFPKTLYSAKNMYIQKKKLTFRKYPVCKKCEHVWKYSECVEGNLVELASGKKIFYLLMTYCYIDLSGCR